MDQSELTMEDSDAEWLPDPDLHRCWRIGGKQLPRKQSPPR